MQEPKRDPAAEKLCPICDKVLPARTVCPECGYDQSCDAEAYGSISTVPASTKSIAQQRREYEEKKLRQQTMKATAKESCRATYGRNDEAAENGEQSIDIAENTISSGSKDKTEPLRWQLSEASTEEPQIAENTEGAADDEDTSESISTGLCGIGEIKNKKRFPLLIIAGLAAIAILCMALVEIPRANKYDEANRLLQIGNYQEAKEILLSLDGYKDTATLVTECDYRMAITLYDEGKYEDAKTAFETLGDYSDSATMVTECDYQTAMALYDKGEYEDAKAAFTVLRDYSDSATMVTECDYQTAMALYDKGEYEDAKAAFTVLRDYSDSATMVTECDYQAAMSLYGKREYGDAKVAFEALGDYKDSTAMVTECDYQIAAECEYQTALVFLDAGEYENAKTAFTALGDYRDSTTMVTECDYQMATALMNAGDYEQAKTAFESLGIYNDAAIMATQCDYLHAKELALNGKYSSAGEYLLNIIGDSDWLSSHFDHVTTRTQVASIRGNEVTLREECYWTHNTKQTTTAVELIFQYVDDDDTMDYFTFRIEFSDISVKWLLFDRYGTFLEA